MTGLARILHVDICVCTFQRPQLLDCLRSLATMSVVPDCEVRILVADNDVTPSAKPVVDQFRQETHILVSYQHCPSNNISIARNACLDQSSAEFLAFIDDDETASRSWLAELVQTMRSTNADAVLGPVQALYDQSAPRWMADEDLHSTFPVFSNNLIKTGYTCNVLMRMNSPNIAQRRFNLARGCTGGEDTEFFSAVFGDGGTISYAQNAWVTEKVPEARASFDWLAKRRIRVGKTHGILLATNWGLLKFATAIPVVSAKIAVCLMMSALNLFSKPKRNKNLLRGMLHIGSFLGMLGFRERASYGAPQPSIQ